MIKIIFAYSAAVITTTAGFVCAAMIACNVAVTSRVTFASTYPPTIVAVWDRNMGKTTATTNSRYP